MWSKDELIQALNHQILDHVITDTLCVDEVVIDSRTQTTHSLFIAITGEINDGHNFLDNAYENGSTIAIISNKDKIPTNHNYILVKDTYQALYDLAIFSRKRTHAKIIALTGSVGKTSVKELLKITFEQYGQTFATKGNLNNHFGVPLSLCNLKKENDFGIFEIGMNHSGEITPLSKLLRPDVAIITNVGPVHIEFFKNEEEIALAKSEIFLGLQKDAIAIINHDNKHYPFLRNQLDELNIKNIATFGQNQDANYHISNYHIDNIHQSTITISLQNKQYSYVMPSCKQSSIFNSAIAFACLNELTQNTDINFDKFSEIKGRGQIIEKTISNKNITIIDDSYNASLPSILAGLKYSLEIKNSLNKKRLIIAIGDMLEVGDKSQQLHEQIADEINALNIDFSILVGEEISKISHKLPKNSFEIYPNSALAKDNIHTILQDGDLLYIKGSRGMKMEEIINN